MNRDLLAAEAESYRKGREALMKEYDHGHAIISTGTHIYLLSEYAEKERIETHRRALEEGRKQGIAMEQARIRKVEWAKLRWIVLRESVIGSVIGCGIILALAIGLSKL